MNESTLKIRNMAQCLLCGETIESKHRHDYVTCKCGNLSVDGGIDYLKRSIVNGMDSYKELSINNNDQNENLDYCDDCDLDNPKCDKCLGS